MSAKLLAGGRMRRTRQKGTKLEDCGDSWRFRYRLWDKDGVEERPTEYIYKKDCLHNGKLSKKVAEDKKAAFMARVNEGNMRAPEPPPPTFNEMIDKWVELILPQVEKPGSRLAFRSRLVHIRAAFGAKHLTEINPEAVQTWIAEQTPKQAAEQIKCILTLMKMVWRYAKIWGYASHDPFEGVRRPKIPRDRTYCFTLQETRDIIATATGWRQLFYWILAETGMRGGECAGLEREGFVNNRLLIIQTVWRDRLQAPKTAASMRNPHITEGLATELRAYLETAPPNTKGLIFATRAGNPISLRKLRADLARICKELKIDAKGKRVGLHSFRHFSASAMNGANVSLKVQQARLGHTNSKMTLHYIHPEDAEDIAAADAIGALLNPKSEGGVIK